MFISSYACACYRSPTDFLRSVTNSLELMYNTRKELIVIGDLNFDLLSDNSETIKFKEYCDQFQLSNSIHKPTRVTEASATLLDLILSSHPNQFFGKWPTPSRH